MNPNPKNDENKSTQNVHGLRKITNWEKYDVKRFPYPGRRRYPPLVYQSGDGGIIISNDVFGLTIRQFEEMYKACLVRRKTHEQYILNLRYPHKSSDEYLEYLENSTDCKRHDEDYRFWNENDSSERDLHEYLVNTVGTEIDIRKRQQLLIIQDIINCENNSVDTQLYSGSLAEGLDLPGSDKDIMYIIKGVDVIRDVRNIKHPVQLPTLLMEPDNDHSGFSRLRLIAEIEEENEFLTYNLFESTETGLYLSVNEFLKSRHKKMSHYQFVSHGPCLTDKNQNTDTCTVVCFHSKSIPFKAMPWASRYRQQWPPNSVIDQIIEYGCLLVPIGPRTLTDCSLLWRLSFSVAEKQLVHSFNYTQLLCYGLLKLVLKHIVNTNNHAKDLLCSYFIKTALFWVSEEENIDSFQLPKLFYCFTLCMNKLILWVNTCFCPNYFIPEQNMFLGKISTDNNKILIQVLNSIVINGVNCLLTNLYAKDNATSRLLRTKSDSSLIKLETLFYRICWIVSMADISRCFDALFLTAYLIKSKSSTFIIDVCKYFYAEISQNAAQVLPPPSATTETYNIHKLYHRLLQDGTNTDAVSGWLLYASFYYVTGQFDITLRLTDYVLSRCSPDMLLIGCVNYKNEGGYTCINNYIKHVHSAMTLHDKMRLATMKNVIYVQNSSLIPGELHLEVKDQDMCLPPTVICHCLSFLCFHHLGDIYKRQKSLRDLNSTINEKHVYLTMSNVLSETCTTLGVCFEISGNKIAAFQCYEKALKCDGRICLSAKVRKLQLFEC